jgi:antitoxin component of MazEF toxin-antitoxin module
MKFNAKVIQIGNSLGVTLPAKESNKKGLSVGSNVSVEVTQDVSE